MRCVVVVKRVVEKAAVKQGGLWYIMTNEILTKPTSLAHFKEKKK